MKSMKAKLKHLSFLVVLFSTLLFTGTVSVFAQELPKCVSSLRSLQPTTDSNVYTYIDSVHGKVNLWISTKRYSIDKTKAGGAWYCNSSEKLVLDTPDVPGTSQGGVPGGTSPQQGGVPAGTPPTSQVSEFPLQVKLKNPLKVDTVQDAIKLFMDAVVKIAIPFIVVFFIWSGINFILAQGNSKKLEDAKRMFWYTVIGTLLILGAWAITDAIVGTINSIAS